ncbi:hypothetical protein JCM3774_006438 [Rhodotorula dairenensis]
MQGTPGTSPAPPSTSSVLSDGTAAPAAAADPEQCLTPPTVRRREARIARCQVRCEAARAAAAATATAQQAGDEPRGTDPAAGGARPSDREEEVAARRRVPANTLGRDHQADALAPRTTPFVRADGTVNWDALPRPAGDDAPGEVGMAAALGFLRNTPALGARLHPDRRAFLGQLETIPQLPSPETYPSFGRRVGSDLPAATAPLLLSAVLVLLHFLRSRRSAAPQADLPGRKVAPDPRRES